MFKLSKELRDGIANTLRGVVCSVDESVKISNVLRALSVLPLIDTGASNKPAEAANKVGSIKPVKPAAKSKKK